MVQDYGDLGYGASVQCLTSLWSARMVGIFYTMDFDDECLQFENLGGDVRTQQRRGLYGLDK